MQVGLRLIAVISFLTGIVWVIQVGSFEPEPVLAFLGGLTSLVLSFISENRDSKEILDEYNRRVMLDHVENFWVKGVLEKSLHGAALLELGIKEEPSALAYPWTVPTKAIGEVLPKGTSILQVFNEVGLGRSLLIMGAPGSGKTTMLLELTRELIERARKNKLEPVPVVFNLASWTETLSLADWLVEQLNLAYYVPKKSALNWVMENRILLLLDGLDEVKPDLRQMCVNAINQFRVEHGLTPIIICSRTEEYRTITTKLALEGAIALQPLTPKQIHMYFERFGKHLFSMPDMYAIYESVQDLAENPLMLSIMVLAYKESEVNKLVHSGSIEEQRTHLLNTYIARMFERSTRAKNASFTKQQTLRYLHWLARAMIKNNVGTYHIEDMKASWLEPIQNRLYRLIQGPIIGLISGLIVFLIALFTYGTMFGWTHGLTVGLIYGPAIGVATGFIFRTDDIKMVDRLKWSWNNVFRSSVVATISSLTIAAIGKRSYELFGMSSNGSTLVGLGYGLLSWVFLIVMSGLVTEQIDATTRPGQRLRQTININVLVVILSWVIAAPLISMIFSLSVANDQALVFGIILGLFLGLYVAGTLVGGIAIIKHYLLRFVLARHEFLPWRLLLFLDYAVELIFLRRVGGGYIFVHRLVMEHFAEMETEQGE